MFTPSFFLLITLICLLFSTMLYAVQTDTTVTIDVPIHLDLGTVHAIATVRVNGKNITTLWKAPYTTEITSALKLGTNTLEVLVTNPWHNRLVGDQQPGSRPTSFTTTSKISAQTPLQPSGLLGPVRLIKKD